jgi:hypothetical protein
MELKELRESQVNRICGNTFYDDEIAMIEKLHKLSSKKDRQTAIK